MRDGIDIIQDSTVAIQITFGKLSGALSISSQPAEAQAYIDGTLVGTTPCIAGGVPYGRHTLKIVKAGHIDYVRNIDVTKPNETVEGTLTILPPGKLIFKIQPYASVSINGQLIEEDLTYRVLERPPGKYTIVLKHPKSRDYQTEVELKSNQSVTIEYKFPTERDQQ
jgi:hypothetical protein